MSELPSVRKVRVFVASPGDMKPERDRVAKVVTRLNQSTARELGLLLEFTDWSSHIRPSMGQRPEDVILEQLGVDTWDIFIGLLWLKFGTPTGAEDPLSRAPFLSGTQEEFTLAYRSWLKTKRPTIMMYRCERMPSNIREINAAQLHLVNVFFDDFEAHKNNPGVYQTFREPEELELQVDKHLSALLFEKSKSKSPFVVAPEGVRAPFAPGQPYEVAAISVDIVRHSEMVKQHGPNAKPVLKWFQQMVHRLCAAPEWARVIWTPDGGIFVISGERMHDRAVITGIRILKEVEMYNLDPSNPIKFRIRVAVADGPLVWEEDAAQISADVLNFTKHLEGSGTEPNGFSITDTLHRHLHESLKKEFMLRPRFEDRRILGYHSDGPSGSLPKRAIPHLVSQVSEELKLLAGKSIQEATSGVDTVYSQLEEFSRHFMPLDDRWSQTYVQEIEAWTTTLLDAEMELWRSIQTNYTRSSSGSAEQAQWKNLADIVSSKRTGAVVPLAQIKANTQIAISRAARPAIPTSPDFLAEKNIETITNTRISAELDKKIRDLVDADDLQEELLLADLLSSERVALIEGVSSNSFGDLSERLLNRLWALTDLILIDELQDSRDGLFAALLKNPITRSRYGALTHILSANTPPIETFVRSRFTSAGLPFTIADLHVVWRSTVVGVTKPERLLIALAKIPVEILWRTIASPGIRVSSLWPVAQRFKTQPDDLKKIFFDCIHARLLREVQVNGREFGFVGKLLSLFFADPLFVQSPYFERLDDLLLNVRRSSSSGTFAVELFDKLAVKLKQVREDRGNPQASMPAGINSLPLAVQRHLAGEGMYIDSFVMHPDIRIAKETERFVTMANVERIIHYRQINESLFHMLLQKKEFFIRPSTLMVALEHPKCTVNFARVNLARIGNAHLSKIAASHSANPTVTQLAKKLADGPRRINTRSE
jgi:hypothetical protein